MLALSSAFNEIWEEYHQVVFDGDLRLVIIPEDIDQIDIKIDVYSSWKEWVLIQQNAKYTPAIRGIGGDPTTAGQKAGDIYFLINGWRMMINLAKTKITGVLFSDDYDTPLVNYDEIEVFQSFVSNLVLGTDVTTVGAWSTAEKDVIMSQVPAIKDKTDRLPNDPASDSTVIAMS